jgi:hypothetical protein
MGLMTGLALGCTYTYTYSKVILSANESSQTSAIVTVVQQAKPPVCAAEAEDTALETGHEPATTVAAQESEPLPISTAGPWDIVFEKKRESAASTLPQRQAPADAIARKAE